MTGLKKLNGALLLCFIVSQQSVAKEPRFHALEAFTLTYEHEGIIKSALS